MSRADGSHPRQVTAFGGVQVSGPNWSPDSRFIAFQARPNGNGDVYVVAAGLFR